MHLHLAAPRAAAHPYVLERSSEARGFMAFEVREGDEHIRIHHRASDLGCCDIPAIDWNLHVVRSLESVAYDDLAACREGREAVLHRRVHVVQSILASSDIERVAVGQKWLSSTLPHLISNDLRPVRPQECEVPRLPEMQLDGGIVVLEVDRPEAGPVHDAPELVQKRIIEACPQIREVNVACHSFLPY